MMQIRSPFQWRKMRSLILLIGLALVAWGTESHAKALRTGETEVQEHRKLARFETPFSITWQIEIGNGQSDREPSSAEHQGVVQATIDWFEESIQSVYGNTAGLALTDFQATLNSSGTSWTPSAADYPHVININCVVVWEANTVDQVPESQGFLSTLNVQSSVRNFIVDYLLVSGPADSIYRFSQRVAYGTSTFNPAPTMPPVMTPAPAPTMSFPNAFVIPARLNFTLGMGESFSNRQPTAQEWSGLQDAVEQWILNSLRAAYSEESSFALSDVTSVVVSNEYDTAAGRYPYKMVLDASAIFGANALNDIPNLVEFFATLRSNQVSLLTFVGTYLSNSMPPNSIFRSTILIQYTSDQNGPRLPAESTTPPESTTTPVSPTPAPVRATPAPVSPDALLATVYTVSNWTYTIDEEFGIQDRPSTQAEFEGLADSTHEWLTLIFERYYNNDNPNLNLPRFVGIESALVRGVHRPNNERPHLMIFNYNITFSVDPNDPTEVVPFIDDIFNVIEQADLNEYVLFFVHTSEPIETSVFHGVDSVDWVYDLSDDYTYVPRPTQPPTGGGGGGGPLAGSLGIDRTRLRNAESNSVSLLMRYRLATPGTGGAPTVEEWDGLLEATRAFWIQRLTEEYSSTSAADFVVVDAKWQSGSTQYTSGDQFPYSGRLDMEVLFTEGSTMQTDVEMRSRMSGLIPGSNYLSTYLRTAQPVDNLFRDTVEIQWDF